MTTPPARRAAQNAVFFKRLVKRTHKEKTLLLIYVCRSEDNIYIGPEAEDLSKISTLTYIFELANRSNIPGAKERNERVQTALWNADDETWDGFFDALKLGSIV